MLSHRHRHRHRHRAGSRRLFTALLAAVAVVATSVMFLPSSPASADEFPPGLKAKVDEAVSDAKFALQRPECNALLSGIGRTGFVSAVDVLDTARPVYQPVPPPPLPANSAASALVGAGLNQDIHIHDPFDEIGVSVRMIFRGSPATSTTDVGLQRAVAILHEVGHLSGVEAQHEARTDAAGTPISAVEEVGLYNTRILNTCFAPRTAYRIGQVSCRQTFDVDLGVIFSTIACDAVCRQDAGPVVVAWNSSLQSTITTDTITDDNGSTFCHSTRVSNCPPPNGYVSSSPNGAFALFPPTDITLTITDASGHVSQDTHRVTCIDPNPNYGW
jgi:hypothetical protein